MVQTAPQVPIGVALTKADRSRVKAERTDQLSTTSGVQRWAERARGGGDHGYHRVVIGIVGVRYHGRDSSLSWRQIEEEVIENETVSKGGGPHEIGRIPKAPRQHAPRRLVSPQPRIEIAAKDAGLFGWQRVNERFGLLSACRVAKEAAFPPGHPILQVRRDDEQAPAGDIDGGGGGNARLSHTRQRDRTRVQDRPARENGVASRLAAIVMNRYEKHRPVSRYRKLLQLRCVLFDGLL